MSSGARASIPSSARKMIQNIKEIAGNHSEEEIYAMFLECSRDPDETAHKLLLQDTFHEVKRKRDRRKETTSNKESTEGRWRPGTQGRGSRGGRGNYTSRYILNDTSGGRNSAPAKENGMNQVPEKGVGILSMPTFQDAKSKGTTPATSSVAVMANEPSAVTPAVNAAQLAAGILSKQSDEIPAGDVSKIAGPDLHLQLVNAKESTASNFQMADEQEHPISGSSNSSAFGIDAPPPRVNSVASDPASVLTHDSQLPSAVGTIKSEVGTQGTPVEQNLPDHSGGKSTAAVSDFESSSTHGKMASLSLDIEKDQLSESAQAASSTHDASSVRSLPNYNSRSQQVIGPQKVGPSKEWKPKLTSSNLSQVSGIAGSPEIPSKAEANNQPHPMSNGLESDKASAKLQRRLQEMHISDSQHVIIPNHLHVPEAEKINFCFGSFDASFSLSIGCNIAPENDKNSALHSESSESVEEMTELSSSQNAFATAEEGNNSDHPQSPRNLKENLSSGEGDGSSTLVPEYIEAKQENALPHGSHQHSTIHTSPSYSYGFMPPMVGTQLAQFESSESQVCDIPRLPSFVVPQPFDPASYYAQFYRSTDNDGRISPFHSHGVATKHNGNVAVLSQPTSQSSPEGGNSLAPSTAGLSPLASQTAGVMQSSIAVTQQPLPAFRQPTGMPITHYHPSYIPYGHFFPPFYVPPPTFHQFVSNGAFPQQPQGGSMYPAPPGAASKYSLSQYKVGSNTGNSTPVGLTRTYGPYGSSPAGYNPNSTSAAGNSTANEDLNTVQLKESNVYVTGQQSEGSAVWIAAPTPGRDVSGLQTNTYYNIPPQGQVTFPPTQTGHGTLASVYHPAQTVSATVVHPLLQQSQTVAAAADTMGPTASVYQHSQHAQINWPNNY